MAKKGRLPLLIRTCSYMHEILNALILEPSSIIKPGTTSRTTIDSILCEYFNPGVKVIFVVNSMIRSFEIRIK